MCAKSSVARITSKTLTLMIRKCFNAFELLGAVTLQTTWIDRH